MDKSENLSGIYHWTRKAIIFSIVVHIMFLVAAGFIVAMRLMHKPQATFQSPDPTRPVLEPRKLEMRVKVQDLQKRSARPKLSPRLVALSPGDVALPEIETKPQKLKRRIKPNVSTLGASGFGSGIGGGFGTGAGGGNGEVTFFGLRGFGERIAIIVDVSLSMCEDQRGGARGYQRVKSHIREVLGSLPIGVFFNVIAFEDSVAVCWDSMQRTTKSNAEHAAGWVSGFNNVEGPYGVGYSNYSPGQHSIPASGGTSRLDLALTAAFEQNADMVFVITDGVPLIEKPGGEATYKEVNVPAQRVTQADIRAWERRVADWERDQDRRRKSGQGPELKEGRRTTGPPRRPGGWGGGVRRIRVDGGPEYWTEEDILKHIKELQDDIYAGTKIGGASINAVGYSVDGDTRSFLSRLSSRNNGRFKSIRGFN